jgi:hypothetical protein
MAQPFLRSPVFWGGMAIVAGAVGYGLYRRRGQLLGREKAGPEPVLVTRNPARMPTPTETRRDSGATVRRFEMPTMSLDERLRLIQKQTWDSIHDARIRHLAGQITKHCGRDDGPCEIKAVFDAVKRRVRYSSDTGPVLNPNTGEVDAIDTYQSAWRTWTSQIGDCDDHVSLIAALLAVMGHTVRLRVTAPTRFGEWSHIYAAAAVDKHNPKKFVAVDTTLPWSNSVVGSEAKYGKARDYVVEVPA